MVTELETTPKAGTVADSDSDEISPAEHRRILVILGALMMGMFLATLDQTIVSTALPTIAGDLHGLNHLTWVVTSYLLTSTISTPLWGKLGDLFGRKKLFQLSIVIFLVGSALSGLSHSMLELILFRALQGVGAGGLIVGSQAIMGDVISPRQRGRYMGYFGAVFASTSVIGPLLGGVFTQDLSWRWVFYINIPVGIIALFVIASVLHIPAKRTEHAIDYWGTTLLGAGVTTIVLLTTWGGSTYAWASLPIVAMIVGSVLLMVGFCLVEARAAEPLIPLGLFRIGVFNISSSVGFIVGFIMFGAVIFIPLYLQTVHGASPTSAGLQLLPMVGGMLITFIYSGRLISKWGRYKIFPIFGTGVTALGLYLLSLLSPTTGFAQYSVYFFVVGFGLGAVMQVLVVAVQNAVPYSQLGTATSSATFFRSIGGVIGIALFGAIFNSRLLAELPKYLPASALKHLSSSGISINPAQINALPPGQRQGYVEAFSHAIHSVFLIGVPFCVVAFGLTWLLKEVPLRNQSSVKAETDLPV